MPYSSGTYSAPASSWNPAQAGTAISPTVWNALLTDISTALSTALLKDGTQTATTSIPFVANLTVGDVGVTQGTVGFRGATSGTLTLSGPAIAGSGTMSLQAGTDTLVGRATTDTLTNKTLTAPIITTPGSGITFAGSSSGSTTLAASAVASGALTLPAATDTLVGKATTDELTNKTLNASVGKGTWTASGTWTLPAFTLGGAVTGTGFNISAAALIPLGTTVPTNGIYLPSANTLGFASNTTVAGVVTSTQQWLLGTGIASALNGETGSLSVIGTAGAARISGTRFNGGGGSGFAIDMNVSNGATAGTHGAVSSGNILGTLTGSGDDGTNFRSAAVGIVAVVDGAVSTGIVPGRMVLQTAAAATGSLTERIRIDSGGQIILGNSQGGALATNATSLMPAMPSCAGAATGTPATSYTGFCPFIYDTTNNKLYIYNQIGAAWKSVQLA